MQVSTWFANARRRLKKENKMTWSPRNRGEDEDDDDDDEVLDTKEHSSKEDGIRSGSRDGELDSHEQLKRNMASIAAADPNRSQHDSTNQNR